MNITTFYNLGSLLNVFLILAGVVVCIYTVKNGLVKALSEVQNNTITSLTATIDSLKTEIDSLGRKVTGLEKENKKLEIIMVTIVDAMKRRGFEINIDGTMVRIRDNKDNSDLNIRIPEAP